MKDVYLWRVKLGEASVEVRAADKLAASKAAARALGVEWRRRARDMEIEKLWRCK